MLKADDVQWVVNDNAELGVKIGDQFFFLYKGDSLVYETGAHDDGSPMHWRTVGKREFGECCHPINYKNPELIGTVSLGDSDRWQQLPPAIERTPPGTEPSAGQTEGRTVLTEAQFAMFCGYLVKAAAAWTSDMLIAPENFERPIDPHTARRFIADMQDRLELIERHLPPAPATVAGEVAKG